MASDSDTASTHESFDTPPQTPREENDTPAPQPEPEPSYNFSQLASNPEWSQLTIQMLPDPNERPINFGNAPWTATLRVRCADLTRLMEDGLFWTPENVVAGEGGPPASINAWWAERGFCHARRWALADRPPAAQSNNDGGGVPRWVAYLDVISPYAELPPRFPLRVLSPRMVWCASAWDPSSRKVYRFDCRSPRENFNKIFDRKPLQGWWPWPKQEWWWPWPEQGWWTWPREDEAGDDAAAGGAERPEGGVSAALDKLSPSWAVTLALGERGPEAVGGFTPLAAIRLELKGNVLAAGGLLVALMTGTSMVVFLGRAAFRRYFP